MLIGVVKENFPGEDRVAMTPMLVAQIKKLGAELLIEKDAGFKAGYTDAAYEEAGATLAEDRAEVFSKSEIVLQVRALGANPVEGEADLSLMKKDQIVIGLTEPLDKPELAQKVAETGAKLVALELVPRITRAQSMDVLSSQASIAGYKAVMMSAVELPRIFPLMMTAAGTLKPARIFIVGAGVAGLQAIATAKRLNAVVSAIDVRPAVKEQVESLGAKFVEPPGASEGEGGYAKEQTEEEKQQQQELMADTVAESNVVITTAAIPGRKAPVLVSKEMVERMAPGSVIVDMAAERGGNCELTVPGETVIHNGVKILGPENIPATVADHASQTFAKNQHSFLTLLVKEGKLIMDLEDEIIEGSLVTNEGEVVHARIRDLLGLEPIAKPEPEPEPESPEAESEAPTEGASAEETEKSEETPLEDKAEEAKSDEDCEEKKDGCCCGKEGCENKAEEPAATEVDSEETNDDNKENKE